MSENGDMKENAKKALKQSLEKLVEAGTQVVDTGATTIKESTVVVDDAVKVGFELAKGSIKSTGKIANKAVEISGDIGEATLQTTGQLTTTAVKETGELAKTGMEKTSELGRSAMTETTEMTKKGLETASSMTKQTMDTLQNGFMESSELVNKGVKTSANIMSRFLDVIDSGNKSIERNINIYNEKADAKYKEKRAYSQQEADAKMDIMKRDMIARKDLLIKQYHTMNVNLMTNYKNIVKSNLFRIWELIQLYNKITCAKRGIFYKCLVRTSKGEQNIARFMFSYTNLKSRHSERVTTSKFAYFENMYKSHMPNKKNDQTEEEFKTILEIYNYQELQKLTDIFQSLVNEFEAEIDMIEKAIQDVGKELVVLANTVPNVPPTASSAKDTSNNGGKRTRRRRKSKSKKTISRKRKQYRKKK